MQPATWAAPENAAVPADVEAAMEHPASPANAAPSSSSAPDVVAQALAADRAGSLSMLKGGITIDDISNQIAQKELDLMKLDTNLKLEQLPDRWAGRRWFLDNLALTSCVATGSYADGAERYRFKHHSKNISKYYFAKCGWTRMIGSWIIVGGSLAEISAMAGRHYREFKRGVDPNTMRKYADGLQNSIDDLLKQRDAEIAVGGTAGPQRAALDKEGEVLHDVRNLAVNEFARFYAQTKGINAATYTGYLIAGLNNALIASGAIAGNHFGLTVRGTARHRTRGTGGAGVCESIAGSLNMTVPVTTRTVAYLTRHRAYQSICHQLDCSEPAHLDKLHADQQQFHSLIANQPELAVHGVVARDSIFAKQAAIFDQHEALRLGEAKAARHKFLSQVIFFESVGAGKLVNGVCTMQGGFRYTNDAYARFEAFGAGRITQGIGYSVATGELLRNQLWGELQSARLRSEGRGTGQILHKQLEELNALGVKGEIVPQKS
jgi:hypothetical protein